MLLSPLCVTRGGLAYLIDIISIHLLLKETRGKITFYNLYNCGAATFPCVS